ncbi:MAG TPA: ATP-binding cassette domain-containing protein [Actinomycetota bacterium]
MADVQNAVALEPTTLTTEELGGIAVRDLGKTYPGGVEALDGVSFDVLPGETFGLLGPNGAGKSTTIGILTTTVRPTRGTARICGFDVASDPLDARGVSSVLFQESVVDRPLTGRRHLELHARLWGASPATAKRRMAEIVDLFELGSLIDRAVGTYSGGERRRLEIARALVSEPRVLFLDEPTVGLDPRIRHELLDVISSLREPADMTILLTTHYLEEAERLSDRLAVMRAGRIVALGTPKELVSSIGEKVVELRVHHRADSALETFRARGIAEENAFTVGATIVVPVRRRAADEVIAAARATGIGIVSAVGRPPTLDDVYLRLTGEDQPQAA